MLLIFPEPRLLLFLVWTLLIFLEPRLFLFLVWTLLIFLEPDTGSTQYSLSTPCLQYSHVRTSQYVCNIHRSPSLFKSQDIFIDSQKYCRMPSKKYKRRLKDGAKIQKLDLLLQFLCLPPLLPRIRRRRESEPKKKI